MEPFIRFQKNTIQTDRKLVGKIGVNKDKSKAGFMKFLFIWIDELISSIGGLTSFGLAVYVFKQTGSATNMALISSER